MQDCTKHGKAHHGECLRTDQIVLPTSSRCRTRISVMCMVEKVRYIWITQCHSPQSRWSCGLPFWGRHVVTVAFPLFVLQGHAQTISGVQVSFWRQTQISTSTPNKCLQIGQSVIAGGHGRLHGQLHELTAKDAGIFRTFLKV